MINESRTQIIITLLLFSIGVIQAQTHPDYQLVEFKTGFNQPVGLENAGDGSNRIFIVEKAGRIKIIEDGSTLPSPFLDITSDVSTSGEQGLLGLAFHPNYASNGFFYVNYIDNAGDTQVSRFTRNPTAPNEALVGSEHPILSVDQPAPATNHNGGCIRFGPDGFLYIALGDGGGSPGTRSQDPQNLLGKMLRIDVNMGSTYTAPATNPFIGDASTLDEIWALGLRNPWRFSFDRLTGDLWIADVGQSSREEVNFQLSSSNGGENYGWQCYEGNLPYLTSGCQSAQNYDFPIFEIISGASRNSISGGFVYRGPNLCLNGVYFCADYVTDSVFTIIPNPMGGWSSNARKLSNIGSIVSFGEDEFGQLYAVDFLGKILMITGDTEMVNGNPISTGSYASNGVLSSSGTVQSGTVNFLAADHVALMPNFQVILGATFLSAVGCPEDQ